MGDYNSKVHMRQGGAELRAESSGLIRVKSGGEILNENVVASTAAATAVNNGLVVVQTTLNQTLAAPALGCHKDVLFMATTGKLARLKTGSTTIFFNSSAGKDFVIEVTAETSQVSNHGLMMTLYGGSTAQWWVGGGFGSTAQWTVNFKSSS